jgi:hypothetical protein
MAPIPNCRGAKKARLPNADNPAIVAVASADRGNPLQYRVVVVAGSLVRRVPVADEHGLCPPESSLSTEPA